MSLQPTGRFLNRRGPLRLAPLPRRLRRLVLGVVAAFAAAVTVAAMPGQSPPPQAKPETQTPQQPTFRAGANLVRVDVYPMLDGAPVRDLTRQDFQVFEDGVPQTIDTFEHVVVRPAGTADIEPVEPNSQREGNALAADPHNRVFVIFLDTYHVRVGGSHNIRKPLIDLIDRVLGPDDLIGIMTPEMPATGLILARKTDVIKRGLTENWVWGRRDATSRLDPVEEQYEICYPQSFTEPGQRSQVAEEMIERRREKLTLDAIHDLVIYLNSIREERKFILAVSDGWQLFPPDSSRLLQAGAPTPPTVGVGTTGRLTTTDERSPVTYSDCERDRWQLANQDDQRYFRDIFQEAARANATFYTIDPRGLPAFDSSISDTPLGSTSITPPSVDSAILATRLDSLRALANNTDGMAVLNSNDIDTGLRKVVADLTSYYLLGYYSTNQKLDGKFRRIEVKIDRPGVNVRARRGYRAPSAAEVAAGARAPAAPTPVSEERAAVDTALGRLAPLRHDTELSVWAVPVGTGGATHLRIAGEMPIALARRDPWRQGGEAAIMVTGAAGATLAMSRVTLAPGAWTFAADLPLSGAGQATDCKVEVRLSPTVRGAATVGQSLRVALPGPEPPVLGEPLLFRRGPTTGAAYLPVADVRFVHADRLRLEAPLAPAAAGLAGRLLDRTGQSLDMPVTVSDRTEGGQRWLVADVSFAPLSKGDYVVELTAVSGEKTERRLVGIRIVS